MNSPESPWSEWVEATRARVEAAGQWRAPRTFDARSTTGVLAGTPGEMVSFASNDYLGLASHPAVVGAAHAALDRWGAGSGGSRLITGSRPIHEALESALAEWKGCQRAVVFPTGFAANLSVLSVFGANGARIYSDELNHASIIDGCRMARATATVFPHGDLGALDGLLSASPERAIIVSDTLFSMDGEEADLEGLVDLAARHRALLVLDEAHAVLGPDLPTGAMDEVDVLRVGTLSKTLGALGGFVAGPARSVELLVNLGRPYIFTTAPTPAAAAAALAAVGIVRSPEGDNLRARLSGFVARIAPDPRHRSPIIPVVMGEEAAAIAASTALQSQGLWVPAIRPPTVPVGTSRLRVTLSAAHTDEQVDRLAHGLAALAPAPRPAETEPAGTSREPDALAS
ncbi:MAG TPA: 8-amino-7-oxononanoate synthase [Acidimicrobiales bacterium]